MPSLGVCGVVSSSLLTGAGWVLAGVCMCVCVCVCGCVFVSLSLSSPPLQPQVYLYTLDETVLTSLYPLLRRAVNFYVHYQIDNATDNKFHLPPTFSPEYAVAPDCNYDLALYRHALGALVSTIDVLRLADPSLALYKDSLARLRDPPSAPVGSQYPGYWIGEGAPLSSGHRHFSHLFMIFPLKQVPARLVHPAQHVLSRGGERGVRGNAPRGILGHAGLDAHGGRR